MKLNIVFLKSEKIITKNERRRIANIIRKTANHAAKTLGFKVNYIINFTVYFFSGKFSWGITEAKDSVRLFIPKKKINENDLKSAVYHETHHIARNFTLFTKRKISLLETLFSEGLAVVFEIERIPKRIPPYSKYTEGLIKKWIPQLKKEKLMNSDFSHDEWFWGKRKKPYRLGYKIGTYLVHQVQKNNPNLTLKKLTDIGPKKLLKLSRVNL